MTSRDQWISGDAYEPYVGRWSRAVASDFLGWLEPRAGAPWLDVGCGTGALTQTILDEAEPSAVRAVDPSAAYVAHARAHVADPRVEFAVGDARSIEAADATFDYVVSGLVLNFVPDTPLAVAEMARVARTGGRVASYVWDYSEGMQLMRLFWDAATELDPRALDLDEGRRFQVCRPEPLRDLWEDAALSNVEVVPIEVPTDFEDFDDYWSPFLGGQGPAPAYAVSLEEDARVELRELLRDRLPVDEDGRISLVARAWALRGIA